MKKHRILTAFLVVIALAVIAHLWLYRWVPVSGLEEIGEYPAGSAIHEFGKPGLRWFPVSEYPFTELIPQNLYKLIGETVELDLESYTYIVGLGYRVVSLQARWTGEEARLGYQRCYGRATLSDDCDRLTVYLYRVPKIWVELPVYRHAHYPNYIMAN